MSRLHLLRRLRALALELQPDLGPRTAARQRAGGLARALHEQAGIPEAPEVLEHGSLSRGTAIGPLPALDGVLALNAGILLGPDGALHSPRRVIGQLHAALSGLRMGPGMERFTALRALDHGVGVAYPGGLQLQIAPARRDHTGLWIPSRDGGGWSRIDPEALARKQAALLARVPELGAAIRLAKGWRRACGVKLSAYAVEAAVMALAASRAGDLLTVLGTFFRAIAEHDKRKPMTLVWVDPHAGPVLVRDPVCYRNNLAADLDRNDRGLLIDRARLALDALDAARAAPAARALPADDADLRGVFVGHPADGG